MTAALDFEAIDRQAAELAGREVDVAELRKVLAYLEATRDPARVFTLLDRLCDPHSRDFELSHRTRGYLEAARQRIQARLSPTSSPEEVQAALAHLGWVARLAGYWGAPEKEIAGRPEPPARPAPIAPPPPPRPAAPPRPPAPAVAPARAQPGRRPAWMLRGETRGRGGEVAVPQGPQSAPERPPRPERQAAAAAATPASEAAAQAPEPERPVEGSLAEQLRAALGGPRPEPEQERREGDRPKFKGSEKARRQQEELMRRLRGG